MHIIIPMSGLGKRFINAGYKDPKPLISVDGKPIIEHVVNLFPGETKFTFVCNEEHIRNTPMYEELKRIAPHSTIMAVPYQPLGPVKVISLIYDHIEDYEEVIVNYCDFGTYWDYQDFLQHTRMRNADGALPSYKGFHPHMLGSTNYAFIKEEQQWLQAIQEKKPFTNNRMYEYASNGTFYFKKGAYIKKYFTELMKQDMHTNGEFYVSMVYSLMAKDGLKTSVYDIQHMLQWGEPQDLQEYQQWSDCFRKLAGVVDNTDPSRRSTSSSGRTVLSSNFSNFHETGARPEGLQSNRLEGSPARPNSVTLVPMAGHGKRFADNGYLDPKPLIEVSGKPMVVQAATSLLPTEHYKFICLQDHLNRYPLQHALEKELGADKTSIIGINQVTQGQACTCEIGIKTMKPSAEVFIVACDNGMVFDKQKLANFIDEENPDVIAFSFRNNPTTKRNPKAYSYLAVDDNNSVLYVSEKQPVTADPMQDHAVVGSFYFRTAEIFQLCVDQLYKKNHRINGEFYADSCVNQAVALGLKTKVFEIDHYVCWGTPNDYETFVYWQSFFHKCSWHPYRLSNDAMVAQDKVMMLDAQYQYHVQASDAKPKVSFSRIVEQ